MNNQQRFQNIDILRGLLMVIMAIDHCFLFFYKTHYSESWNVSIPNYWNFLDANGGNSGVYRMYFIFDIQSSLNNSGVFNISLLASDNSTLLRTSFNGTDNTITMQAID